MAKPEIRFKGFDINWCLCKLKSFAKRITRKNSNLESKLPLTISSIEGLVSQYDYFNNRIASNNISGYYLLMNGEFAYNKSYSSGYPFGSVKRLDKYEMGVLSTLYIVFAIDNSISSDYLTHFFDTTLWHHEVAIRAAEGARNHGLLNIGAEDFLDINISLPSSKVEQQTIANFFKSLDSLIQTTTKKISSLKQMKSASLISMFPKEGETTPRVRFKGFKGEWKHIKLSDCLSVCNDRNLMETYNKEHVLSVSDDYGVVNQIKLLGRSYAGKSVANYRILKTGDIVYTKSPLKMKPFGIIKVNEGNTGIVSTLYAVYSPKEGISSQYLSRYFEPSSRMNKYIHPLVNKGAKNDMKVRDENVLAGNIYIPKDISEQQLIASYFSSLDKQISLQEQRLEKLKQIKSACLDKMFV